MHEALNIWMQRSPTVLQNFALRIPDAMPGNPQEGEGRGSIVVERFSNETGDEAIRLSVDPASNEWQETAIGTLRVGAVTTTSVRGNIGERRDRRSIRIWFKQDVKELLAYGKGHYRLIEDRFRDIPLNEDGIGWDELGKKNEDGERVEKFKIDERGYSHRLDWHKWLIVDIGNSLPQALSETEPQAIAAD